MRLSVTSHKDTCTLALAHFACHLRYEAIPEEVLAHLRTLIMDHLACTIGGANTELAKSVLAYAHAFEAVPVCPVPGTDLRTHPMVAAFVWATLANALDYDDTGSRGHPGASLIPAVLSLGMWVKSSFKELCMALVEGYEISERVAKATLPSPQRYSVIHANGSIQAIGVAAACARLMGFDVPQTQSCMGLAGTMTPVPHAGKFGWHDPSICSIKDNVALPAEHGIRAALLVRHGFEGTLSIMDEPSSFGAMLGSDRCDEALLCDFSQWYLPHIAIKPYPCCRWIHTALDGLDTLMEQSSIDTHHIARMDVVTTPSVAEKFGKYVARTLFDVEFSTPLSLALRVHKVPRVCWHEAVHWQDARILETAKGVTLQGDEVLQERFLALGRLASRIPSTVTLYLHDGTVLQTTCDMAKGTFERPLSDIELTKKWQELLLPTVGMDVYTQVMRAVQDFSSDTRFDALFMSLCTKHP